MQILEGAKVVPEPPRPLGIVGRTIWEEIWRSGALWIALHTDSNVILALCERMDERDRLRKWVMSDEGFHDWKAWAALRMVDGQAMAGLSAIGFTPVDRARLQVAEVGTSELDEHLAKRASRSA